MQALTDTFECQFFSCLVREYVGSCNICQRTKYSQRRPIGDVTPLHVPVRPWRNITMDFLKLSPIFTKCSVLYPNIPEGNDHIVCMSRLRTIVDRQSGFKFLIPGPDNLTAEQYTAILIIIYSLLRDTLTVLFLIGILFLCCHTSRVGQQAEESNWKLPPPTILKRTVHQNA